MMLMMNDEVVVEKAESAEKERSALAREIEFRLTPYLYQLGIPPHVTGYCYLRSAVVEFLLNPSEMREITKTIYPRIALEHGTTVSAVERAIRHAIAAAWNNGGLRGIKGDPCTVLLTFRRKPTNVFTYKRQLFCAKKQLPESSCKIKTMLRYGAGAACGRILPADKARFSPHYCPFKS